MRLLKRRLLALSVQDNFAWRTSARKKVFFTLENTGRDAHTNELNYGHDVDLEVFFAPRKDLARFSILDVQKMEGKQVEMREQIERLKKTIFSA